jgi:hypothetical protein
LEPSCADGLPRAPPLFPEPAESSTKALERCKCQHLQRSRCPRGSRRNACPVRKQRRSWAGRAIHCRGSGHPRVGPSTGRAIHCCTRPQRAPQVIIKTRLMTHQPNWRGLPAPWMSDNGWPWSPRRDLMSVLHRIETIAGPGFHAGPHNQSAAGRVVEDGKAGDSNVSLGPFGFEKTQRLSYGEQGVSRWRTGSRVTV